MIGSPFNIFLINKRRNPLSFGQSKSPINLVLASCPWSSERYGDQAGASSFCILPVAAARFLHAYLKVMSHGTLFQ